LVYNSTSGLATSGVDEFLQISSKIASLNLSKQLLSRIFLSIEDCTLLSQSEGFSDSIGFDGGLGVHLFSVEVGLWAAA